MGLIAEVWTRPGDANFGRVIDGIPDASHAYNASMNQMGNGSMRIPSTFTRFDEIIVTDEATPANSVRSLVRLFDDSDMTTPIGEWLPNSITPTTDIFDLDIDIGGLGINSVMDWARCEAYDWDGSDDWVPTFPDWIYGGNNALRDGGFENPVVRSTKILLWNDATTGTFTLSDGTDTTSALAYDIAATTLETTIEADITAWDDVNVSGSGTEDDPWVLEFIDPFTSSGVNFQNPTDSFGGGESSTWTTSQFGALQPSGWTKSQSISDGTPREFGAYDSFVVSTGQAHTGTYSLFIDPASIPPRYAGTQQVVNVTPGGTYQASIWVYPTGASQEYRLVLRDIDEDFIAAVQLTATQNTWNELSISDIIIPDGVTQLIFRFANINASGDPSGFYVDDGELNEGLQPTTPGAIMGDLYADATSDHSGRIVWEDLANPGSPWLTLDFSDSLDSAGDAWFEQDISIRLWMRMSYRQVLDQLANTYGIEWRVVPDDVEAGTWLLQMYNPGGMMTNYSNAQTPAIQGGASDVRRAVMRFVPSATNHLVEGLGRITSRHDTTGLEAAIGRIEGQRIDKQLPTAVGVDEAAYADANDATSNAQPYTYDLVNPQDLPLSAYTIGDVLTIHDPPEVNDTARLIDVELVSTPEVTTYQVQFFPTTPAGS